jgi:RNA polymerase sigma-70 factor (family 1)
MHESKENKIHLNRLAESDQNAFSVLFNKYCQRVHHFALKLTHSEVIAEEVVQDVFMKIWMNRRSLGAIECFEAYLFTICRNHTFNILKRLAREEIAKAALGREILAHHETEETVMYDEAQEILHQAVDKLPPQQRLVYSLCHQKGLKYEEVASQLNISRLTVKTHMQQALRSIKSHMSSTFGSFGCIILFIL